MRSWMRGAEISCPLCQVPLRASSIERHLEAAHEKLGPRARSQVRQEVMALCHGLRSVETTRVPN